MNIAASITDLIGNTPLVQLNHVTAGCTARVVLNLESDNSAASVKDRIGLAMIEAAERDGKITPASPPSSCPPAATPASASPTL